MKNAALLLALITSSACLSSGPECRDARTGPAEVIDLEQFSFETGDDVQCFLRYATLFDQQDPAPVPPQLVVVLDNDAGLADQFICTNLANDTEVPPPPSGIDFETSRLLIEYQEHAFSAGAPSALLVNDDGTSVLLIETERSCGSGAAPPAGYFGSAVVMPAGDGVPPKQTCFFGPEVSCGFSQPP